MNTPFHFTGVIPILATPFHDDESIDLDSLARLIRFNTSVGVDGVTVLGLLGSSIDTSTSEQLTRLLNANFSNAVSLTR